MEGTERNLGSATAIIGGGLAGCELAYQLARRGHSVRLSEMRPLVNTAAHGTEGLAELVCSNSLRSDQWENPVGWLKREMEALDSLIMRCARRAALPAGSALAVDRLTFSSLVEAELAELPQLEIVREEVITLGPGPTAVAAGPLCSNGLFEEIARILGDQGLFFYDAIAPVLELDSLDMTHFFYQSRYGKGQGEDYLNLPLDEAEYRQFHQSLLQGECAPLHPHDRACFFEGCLPIEVMAARGMDTLRHGPMKPVGLVDPRTREQPYAVIQFRQDNFARSLWNMVGFQTQLKWSEQDRIFRQLPGMNQVRFVRHGMVHRNTFVNGARHLLPTFQCRSRPELFFAGQISGVEGYLESAASGLMVGIHMHSLLSGAEPVPFPRESALGSLAHYVAYSGNDPLRPSNINFGIMEGEDLHFRGAKRDKRLFLLRRARAALLEYAHTLQLPLRPEFLPLP
jgi:methylenetetrahydrofolate--tRNA-(uracil-5-)-methyltransferase